MQSYLRIGLFTFIISFCIYQGYTYLLGYKKYIPSYFNGDEFFQSRDSLTEIHKMNIQKVFTYYDVSYKVEGGQVFYRGHINEELLWNYTTHASDTQWLKTHN
ncbi:MAG TPA: hypothetical protein VD794_13945 [Flavisolibacter sp.]|nr:hypothetical protein [Flavisolibacter sp.]